MDISNRKYLSKTILACRERQANKYKHNDNNKAGALFHPGIKMDSTWLSIFRIYRRGKDHFIPSNRQKTEDCRAGDHLWPRHINQNTVKRLHRTWPDQITPAERLGRVKWPLHYCADQIGRAQLVGHLSTQGWDTTICTR